MALLRKSMHLGQDGIKYDFEISKLKASHKSLRGRLLSLSWMRGSRKGSSTRKALGDTSGVAVWQDEVLKVPCTLYLGNGGKFAGKEIRITIEEVVRAGVTKSLGIVKVPGPTHPRASPPRPSATDCESRVYRLI